MADNDYILRKDALAFQDEIEPALCFDNKTRNIFSATKDADLVAYLNTIPPANVRPVVRGIWEPGETIFFCGVEHTAPRTCSVCGRSALDEPWYFCPNCGAMMRAANDRPYEWADSSLRSE